MSPLLGKIIGLGFVLLLLAAVAVPPIVRRTRRNARSGALAKLAAEQGWTYVAAGDAVLPLVRWLPGSYGRVVDQITDKLLRMDGPTRLRVTSAAANVIEANADGRDLQIFDWVAFHAVRKGTGSVPHMHTVWAIELPRVPFWLQAASMAQRWDEWQPGTWFATGDADFDRRFRVSGDDAARMRAGLTTETRRLLLDSGFDGWRLEPEFRMLLLWTYSLRRHAPVEQIVELSHRAVRLAAAASTVGAA